jgi:hypothetical protein
MSTSKIFTILNGILRHTTFSEQIQSETDLQLNEARDVITKNPERNEMLFTHV